MKFFEPRKNDASVTCDAAATNCPVLITAPFPKNTPPGFTSHTAPFDVNDPSIRVGFTEENRFSTELDTDGCAKFNVAPAPTFKYE